MTIENKMAVITVNGILGNGFNKPLPNNRIRFTAKVNYFRGLDGIDSEYITDFEGRYNFLLNYGYYDIFIYQDREFKQIGTVLVDDGTPNPATLDGLIKYGTPYIPSKYDPEPAQWQELFDELRENDELNLHVVDQVSFKEKVSQQFNEVTKYEEKYGSEIVNTSTVNDSVSQKINQFTYIDDFSRKASLLNFVNEVDLNFIKTVSEILKESNGYVRSVLFSEIANSLGSSKIGQTETSRFKLLRQNNVSLETNEAIINDAVSQRTILNKVNENVTFTYNYTSNVDSNGSSLRILLESIKSGVDRRRRAEILSRVINERQSEIVLTSDVVSVNDIDGSSFATFDTENRILNLNGSLVISNRDDFKGDEAFTYKFIFQYSNDKITWHDQYQEGFVWRKDQQIRFKESSPDDFTLIGDPIVIRLNAIDGEAGDNFYLQFEYTNDENYPNGWRASYIDGDDWKRWRNVTVSNGVQSYSDWYSERIKGENGREGIIPVWQRVYGIDGTRPLYTDGSTNGDGSLNNLNLQFWHQNMTSSDIYMQERRVFFYTQNKYILSKTDNAVIPDEVEPWSGPIKIKPIKGIDYFDGETLYTWIRYADSATGEGMSNEPDGKLYIGFGYNKTSPIESNDPTLYKWSLIKGVDGVDGADGDNGEQLYTWIAYSDNSDGDPMYQIPNDNTKYIGIAVNKVTPTESNDHTEYTWSKFRGEQGVAGQDGQPKYTWIKYADTSAGVGISNSPEGKTYIGFAYNKTIITESNDPTDYIWSLIKGSDGTDGVKGDRGDDGQQLYTWIAYSDNSTGLPLYQEPRDSTLYIGIAVNKLTATESSSPADYTWSKFRGEQGVAGVDGVQRYTWIKYADTDTGVGISNSPEGKGYIGFAYNKTTNVESDNPLLYTWSLIKGTNGTNGVDGARGDDGQTLYTWISYSDNADGNPMYQTPNSNTLYIGIAVNKTVQEEGTNPSEYVWSKFKGDDGVAGTNGTNGTNGVDGRDGLFGAGSYIEVYPRTITEANRLTNLQKESILRTIKGGQPVNSDILTLMDRHPNPSYIRSFIRNAEGVYSPFLLAVDGNAVINGTLTANKLRAGTVLTNLIRVGTNQSSVNELVLAGNGISGREHFRLWVGNSDPLNARLTIDKEGNLRAINAYVRGRLDVQGGSSFTGNINASGSFISSAVLFSSTISSGTINGGTINGSNGNFTGTVHVNKLMGDVYKVVYLKLDRDWESPVLNHKGTKLFSTMMINSAPFIRVLTIPDIRVGVENTRMIIYLNDVYSGTMFGDQAANVCRSTNVYIPANKAFLMKMFGQFYGIDYPGVISRGAIQVKRQNILFSLYKRPSDDLSVVVNY